MDTKTIDQRIRQKARDGYWAELQAASKQFTSTFFESFGGGAQTAIANPKNNSVHPYPNYWAGELLDEICKGLFKEFAAKHEEAAVAAFLARVDSLSNEVAELRGSIDE